MKTFKQYINEETMPFANVKSGEMNVENSSVRDQINQLLAGVTSGKFVTPYIPLERVAKTLANFHIFIPNQHFLEGESGTMVWPVKQFGNKAGMNDQGQFVVDGQVKKDLTHGPHIEGEGPYEAPEHDSDEYSIYFEYRQGDCGMFYVFCEVVDSSELEEIMDDLESELNDDEEKTVSEESGYYFGKQKVTELKMSDEQQLDEKIVSKAKKLVKYLKRGTQGWSGNYNLPLTGKENKPKDVVRRAKALDEPTAKKLLDKDDKSHSHSPAGLQQRVIRKRLKIDEAETLAPETGPRKTPGSNQMMAIIAKVSKSKKK
jgi:hypothetical protein